MDCVMIFVPKLSHPHLFLYLAVSDLVHEKIKN